MKMRKLQDGFTSSISLVQVTTGAASELRWREDG